MDLCERVEHGARGFVKLDGAAHLERPVQSAEVGAEDWAAFLYVRDNTRGVHAERWRHAHGCGRFFNALRDTTTDFFLATYKVGEPRPAVPAR